MTGRHYTDCCPACGSSHIIPYAVLVGGSEEYGYQCAACQVMWPVFTYPPISIGGAERQDSPTA